MNKISIGAGIVMTLSFLILGLTEFRDNTAMDFVDAKYNKIFTEKSSSLKIEKDLPVDFDEKDDVLASLYESRADDYFKNSEKMSNLIQLLSAMIVVGLLILFYKPAYLQLPIISINIPDTLLYLFVSIGLVYLWIQFGLTLNSGIDSRLALIHLTKLREAVDDQQVTYTFSNSNVFSDNSVIDTWCSYYHEIFKEGDQNIFHEILGFFGLFGIYGVFISFIHSTCLALIVTFYKAKKIAVILILYYFSLGMFILSGTSFVFEFKHGALFMAWVWAIITISLFWWNKKEDVVTQMMQSESESLIGKD